MPVAKVDSPLRRNGVFPDLLGCGYHPALSPSKHVPALGVSRRSRWFSATASTGQSPILCRAGRTPPGAAVARTGGRSEGLAGDDAAFAADVPAAAADAAGSRAVLRPHSLQRGTDRLRLEPEGLAHDS